MEVDTVNYFKIDDLVYNIKYTFKVYNTYNDSYEVCYIHTLYKNGKFVTSELQTCRKTQVAIWKFRTRFVPG